jgi:hypothetical protein
MADPYAYNPLTPVARPAASLAAVLALSLSSSLAWRSAERHPVASIDAFDARCRRPSSGYPHWPAAVDARQRTRNFDLFWQALDTIRQNYVGRSDLCGPAGHLLAQSRAWSTRWAIRLTRSS